LTRPGGLLIRSFVAQKLFGEVALELGFVTTDKLYEALTIQARADVEKKPYRALGQILLELGHMTEKQVLEVLKVIHGGGSRRSSRAASKTKKRA
jgi:hypothetical protein